MVKKVEIKKGTDLINRMSEVASKLDDGTGVEIIRSSIQKDGSHTNLSVFTSRNKDIEFKSRPNIKVEVSSTEQENDRLLHSFL